MKCNSRDLLVECGLIFGLQILSEYFYPVRLYLKVNQASKKKKRFTVFIKGCLINGLEVPRFKSEFHVMFIG